MYRKKAGDITELTLVSFLSVLVLLAIHYLEAVSSYVLSTFVVVYGGKAHLRTSYSTAVRNWSPSQLCYTYYSWVFGFANYYLFLCGNSAITSQPISVLCFTFNRKQNYNNEHQKFNKSRLKDWILCMKNGTKQWTCITLVTKEEILTFVWKTTTDAVWIDVTYIHICAINLQT